MVNGEQFKTIKRECISIIQLIKQDALKKYFFVNKSRNEKFLLESASKSKKIKIVSSLVICRSYNVINGILKIHILIHNLFLSRFFMVHVILLSMLIKLLKKIFSLRT